MEEEKTIGLQDILQLLTGSKFIIPEIKNDKIMVQFKMAEGNDEGQGFIVNTCNKSITFPLTKMCTENFGESFINFVVNSPGFGRI